MNALTNEERARLILSVGKGGAGGKRLLNPIQVSEYIERCVRAGSTVQELSKVLTIGQDMIGRFRSLRKLPESIQSLVEFASSSTTLSFSAAHQISRLKDAAAQEALAKAAIAYNLSKMDLAQAIERYERSHDTIEKAVEAILALQPHIERRHVVIGAVKSERLRKRISDLRAQDQRDNWGRKALLEEFGNIDFSIRLTPDRFTLSGNDELYAALMKLQPDFETAIDSRLLAHIDDL